MGHFFTLHFRIGIGLSSPLHFNVGNDMLWSFVLLQTCHAVFTGFCQGGRGIGVAKPRSVPRRGAHPPNTLRFALWEGYCIFMQGPGVMVQCPLSLTPHWYHAIIKMFNNSSKNGPSITTISLELRLSCIIITETNASIAFKLAIDRSF